MDYEDLTTANLLEGFVFAAKLLDSIGETDAREAMVRQLKAVAEGGEILVDSVHDELALLERLSGQSMPPDKRQSYLAGATKTRQALLQEDKAMAERLLEGIYLYPIVGRGLLPEW